MNADKDAINIDVQPIVENVAIDTEKVLKSVEDTPPADLLKADEPVAIPSDLDFTPDEALNELVSSDILAVIPEQPVEEVKEMNSEPVNTIASEPTEIATAPTVIDVPNVDNGTVEPADVTTATDSVAVAVAVAPADEMNVETTVESGNATAEDAMEAAPIKSADAEEQMDVDESNSVDAMDL